MFASRDSMPSMYFQHSLGQDLPVLEQIPLEHVFRITQKKIALFRILKMSKLTVVLIICLEPILASHVVPQKILACAAGVF
jgi:hypothetical protein